MIVLPKDESQSNEIIPPDDFYALSQSIFGVTEEEQFVEIDGLELTQDQVVAYNILKQNLLALVSNKTRTIDREEIFCWLFNPFVTMYGGVSFRDCCEALECRADVIRLYTLWRMCRNNIVMKYTFDLFEPVPSFILHESKKIATILPNAKTFINFFWKNSGKNLSKLKSLLAKTFSQKEIENAIEILQAFNFILVNNRNAVYVIGRNPEQSTYRSIFWITTIY